jgi:tetratricopeptide (TPR) repeat protein
MRTNKNGGLTSASILIAMVLALLCGCTPPGPRALLKGERLIREGKHKQAIQQLQTATRLLPKSAQAWNHLGLAHHGAKQPEQAAHAYRQALALDQNLSAARYNLGCLLLEQNELAGAIDQLTSYTLLVPNAADGWLKLATAQLRARKLDLAEKNFKAVLESQSRHAEALNGLGIVQVQRKRPADGLYYFNQALAQNANYGPALLNAAILNHQNANNRPAALQKYRQYLALQPRPPNWDVVAATANQLDAELNPPAVQVARTEPVPPPVTRATEHALPQTNIPTKASTTTSPPVAAAARTNTVFATNPPKVTAPTSPALTNLPPVATRTAVVETARPPPVVPKTTTDVEVTRLQDDLIIQPPQDISVSAPASTPAKTNVIVSPTPSNPMGTPSLSTQPKPDKRSLLSRLNPFGGKAKPSSDTLGPAILPDQSSTGKIMAAASPSSPVATIQPAPRPVPRYAYLSPAKPASGRHEEAMRYFSQGVKEYKARRISQAVSEYQKAAKANPAYFDAYYNLGLASYEMGNWRESLNAYEYALALKPDSADARYNFALALKRAGYPQDAAEELLRILQNKPGEARAHLSLANLYAQQLNQPQLAREHYVKVLESEPRHPQATEIRYWLAANP